MSKRLSRHCKHIIMALIIVLIFVLAPQLAIAEGGTACLYFDLECKENLFFNKYNVEVFLDDTHVGTLEHGELFTLLSENVPLGDHTVTFYKEGQHKVSGSTTLTLKKDSTLRCVLKTDGRNVVFQENVLVNGVGDGRIIMPELSGKTVGEAKKQLEGLHFKNITAVNENGQTVEASGDWVVISQNIKVGSQNDKLTEIKITCQATNVYLEKAFSSIEVKEAVEKLNEYNYKASFKKALTGAPIGDPLKSLPEEEWNDWSVSEVSYNGNQKVDIYLQYKGKRNVPEVSDMNLDQAESLLKQNDFSNIKYKTASATGTLSNNKDSWYVISQDKIGEEADVSMPVVLTVVPYDELAKVDLWSEQCAYDLITPGTVQELMRILKGEKTEEEIQVFSEQNVGKLVALPMTIAAKHQTPDALGKTTYLFFAESQDRSINKNLGFQMSGVVDSKIKVDGSSNKSVNVGDSGNIVVHLGSYDPKSNLFQVAPLTISIKTRGAASTQKDKPFTKETIRAMQAALNEAGYDCGSPDGDAGPRTHGAILQYSKDHGIGDTDAVTETLLGYLAVPVAYEEPTPVPTKEVTKAQSPEATATPEKTSNKPTYVGNRNTKKFHYPSCGSVNKMKEKNKVFYYGDRSELINDGYIPCQNCDP